MAGSSQVMTRFEETQTHTQTHRHTQRRRRRNRNQSTAKKNDFQQTKTEVASAKVRRGGGGRGGGTVTRCWHGENTTNVWQTCCDSMRRCRGAWSSLGSMVSRVQVTGVNEVENGEKNSIKLDFKKEKK